MARPSSLLPRCNLLLTKEIRFSEFTCCVWNNTATKHPPKQLTAMKQTKNASVRPKKYANTFCRKEMGVQRTVRVVIETIGIYLKRKLPCWICAFESQSFNKPEAGTLLAAPGCGGKATAGSPWGRCCWSTERAGTECCGRWLGLCTPGRTH